MQPSGPGSPASATLDPAALAKLRELDPKGELKVVQRIFGAYEESLLKFMKRLQEQVATPQSEVVIRIAHTIKSSSASVGAMALSRRCEALERHLRTGGAAQTHDVQELLVEIEAALVAVRAMLAR